MNSDTIYVFDPITSAASHSVNNEGVFYVSAPHSTTTGPPLQIIQGTMLLPGATTSQDSVPTGSHVMSVNAYPVPYAVVPSPNQAYDVNRFDLSNYTAISTAIPTGRPTFARSFTSQGRSPRLEPVPVYLVGPLSQEQQHTPNRVNSSFPHGFTYLELPYINASSQIHPPHTAGGAKSVSTQLNLMPNIDQSRLTVAHVPTSASAPPLISPSKARTMSTASLIKSSEPVTTPKALGTCENANSSSFPYPTVTNQPNSGSSAPEGQLNSPVQAEMGTTFPHEHHMSCPSFPPKEGKQLSRFMGVRGFLAPPPLGVRIVPGTTTLLDIPPLAIPEPTWGILPQAALLAE